jgi:kinesin family protein 11
MGTAASNFADLTSIGIIPRTVYEIFKEVEQRREKSSVEVRASFIEIYNEQIIDLLSDAHLKDPKYSRPHAGTRIA